MSNSLLHDELEKVYDFIPSHKQLLKEQLVKALTKYIDSNFDSILSTNKQNFINQQVYTHQDEAFNQPITNNVSPELLTKLINNIFNLPNQSNNYHEYSYEFAEDYASSIRGLNNTIFMSIIALADSIIDPQTIHQ